VREAIPLRLIETEVRRTAGRLILPIVLLVAVFGLPCRWPVDLQPASARTIGHAHSRPLARRHPVRRTTLTTRRARGTSKRVASHPRRAAQRASLKKTTVLKPSQKKLLKASGKTPALQKDSQKKAVTQNSARILPPVELDQKTLFNRIYSLRDQGLNEQLAGDYGPALRHLMEATQLSSAYHVRPTATESLLYLDLADCAEQAGLPALARQAYGQLLERSPRSSEAHIRLGRLLARLGHVREATSAARQAIALDPASPKAHLLLALLLEHQGELAEARAERDSSRALLESRPINRRPEPEVKASEASSGDFTPTGPEELDEGPPGLP